MREMSKKQLHKHAEKRSEFASIKAKHGGSSHGSVKSDRQEGRRLCRNWS